jgi:hypothetical protein
MAGIGRSPKEVSKETFQFEVRGFRRSPTRRIIHMSSSQYLGADLKFARKGERLGNPVFQLLFNPGKNCIPELNNRSLEGERNAQKAEDLPVLKPFPPIVIQPGGSWKKRLPVAECFRPLNGGPRSEAKNIQALDGIGNILLILNESEKGIICKVTIDKLLVRVRKGDTPDSTHRNGISKKIPKAFSSDDI